MSQLHHLRRCQSCNANDATLSCQQCVMNFCNDCGVGHMRVPVCRYHVMEKISSGSHDTVRIAYKYSRHDHTTASLGHPIHDIASVHEYNPEFVADISGTQVQHDRENISKSEYQSSAAQNVRDLVVTPSAPSGEGYSRHGVVSPKAMEAQYCSNAASHQEPSAPELPPPAYDDVVNTMQSLTVSNSPVMLQTDLSDEALKIESFKDLIPATINLTYKLKKEEEIKRCAMIDGFIWLIESNGLVHVTDINSLIVLKHLKVDGGIKVKAAIQLYDGCIIIASKQGLCQINNEGRVITQIAPGDFKDVTTDSAVASCCSVFALEKKDGLTIHCYARESGQWKLIKKAQCVNSKRFFPKLLVHNFNIFLVKDQTWLRGGAKNYLYKGYFDIQNQYSDIRLEILEKHTFKDNPRLCSIDSHGNILLGEWGEPELRIYMHNGQVETACKLEKECYMQDALVLKSGSLITVSYLASSVIKVYKCY